MSTQYFIWALGLVQVYRYRRPDPSRRRPRRARGDRPRGAASERIRAGWTHDPSISAGRVQGDVVELILDDHRRFETLLRDLRDSSSDRDAVRRAFAALHVAHAQAEEKFVYPKLRKKHAVGAHEAEHGEEEHAEGHEALLAVLELKGTDTQAFDDAVEELAKVVNHHLTEEELTILNPAREEVGPQVRAELGEQFAHGAQRPDRRRLRHPHQRPQDRRRGPQGGLLDDDEDDDEAEPVDVEQLQAYCLAKPGAWPDFPWEHDHPVIKVGPGGAARSSRSSAPSGVGVKGGATREVADEWLDRFPGGATVMRYIGRSGWNDLTSGAIPDEELLEAVDESYRLVVGKLPKKHRPDGWDA